MRTPLNAPPSSEFCFLIIVKADEIFYSQLSSHCEYRKISQWAWLGVDRWRIARRTAV
jgi:hypothetical protein